MSRKILQVGSDILTINDKLVSVTEDYPFWKVNLPTSDQYFNKLKTDLATPPDVDLMMNPFEITSSNTFGLCSGMIAASNGSIYTIPNTATTITKITPNLADPTNPTITNIGSFSVTAGKFTGAHEVNGKIIFMPSSFESIMILDLSDESISFVGSLGTATSKFGLSVLADNGLIIAPAYASTQHLIFNPQTLEITLQPCIVFNGANQIQKYANVNAGNGYVYMAPVASTSTLLITRINMDTLVEERVETSFSPSMGGLDNFISSGFAYEGNVYFYRPASSLFIVFNTKDNDSKITFSSGMPINVSFNYHPSIGPDGWVYYFHNFTNSGQPHFRINPINNTIQRTPTSLTNTTIRNQCSVMGIDGNLYSVNVANKINVYDFNSNVEIVPNRIYSKYNIR